jgi:hypothetical protein
VDDRWPAAIRHHARRHGCCPGASGSHAAVARHNGNEKHAELAQPLPVSASTPGTVRSGDLLLYGSKTVVVFYATFESRYAYTRLGRVDDPATLAQALGSQGARVTFSLR